MSGSLDFGEAWRFFDSLLNCCNCPSEGSFIGWKGAVVLHDYRYDGGDVQAECCLVKLGIPEDSPRLKAYYSKKCRCKYAEVTDIQLLEGASLPDDTVAYSIFEMFNYVNDPSLLYRTKYKKGEVIVADYWDDYKYVECSHGIHFFMNREDAISYATSWG